MEITAVVFFYELLNIYLYKTMSDADIDDC